MTYAKVPAFSGACPASAGTSLLSIALFLALGGCASASFSVGNVLDASEKTEPDVTSQDGGLDAKSDSVLPGCVPYSCKVGCGECDVGMECGNGGQSMCGSINCGPVLEDANVNNITCAGAMTRLFQCRVMAAPDLMPSCAFAESSGGKNWYCCK